MKILKIICVIFLTFIGIIEAAGGTYRKFVYYYNPNWTAPQLNYLNGNIALTQCSTSGFHFSFKNINININKTKHKQNKTKQNKTNKQTNKQTNKKGGFLQMCHPIRIRMEYSSIKEQLLIIPLVFNQEEITPQILMVHTSSLPQTTQIIAMGQLTPIFVSPFLSNG